MNCAKCRYFATDNTRRALAFFATHVAPPRAQMNGDELLRQRGILEAAKRQRWCNDSTGWTYPVFGDDGSTIQHDRQTKESICRWKSYSSNATPKCRWVPGKPDHVQYYFPTGTTLAAAVRRDHGVLYVANGEPSVLSFLSAGIPNVVCWFGELNIPASFAHDCERWGVREVRNYPDLDNTGWQAGVKIARMFAGSKVRYQMFDLPNAAVPAKGDINDLWKAAAFKPKEFCHLLERCSPLTSEKALARLPTEIAASKSTNGSRRPVASPASDDTAALLAYIEHLLGVQSDSPVNNRGFCTVPIRCPAKRHEHDHERPAAFWHRKGAFVHCFKCGKRYPLHELVELLGCAIA